MTIDKIKLPDNTVVDLVNNQTIVLNADTIWTIVNVNGSASVEPISGTAGGYLMILTQS